VRRAAELAALGILATAMATAGALAGPTSAHAAVPRAPAVATGARVVVIAVPDLRWSDLAVMPRLAAYAAISSVGDLSVRGEPTASRCADGSLTFAAGNRADAGGATGCAISSAQRAGLLTTLRNDRYGADIGAFGDALRAAGVSTAAVGPGANLLVADSGGRVGFASPDLAPALDRGEVVAVVDDGLYLAPATDRAAAARRIDAELAVQLAAVPASTMTIVAGTSDGRSGGPHLHVVVIHGPGWRHVELSSPTTRSQFVQLIDLAPTVLARLGLATPKAMIGRGVYDSTRAAQSASAYVDADRHDQAARRVDGSIRTAFGVAAMVVLALVVLAWWRRSQGVHRLAVWLSRWAIGLPIASYLLQLVPWWRPNLGWYPVLLAAVMLVIAGLTTLAIRRGIWLGVIAVPALIAAVLTVDQLLGAPLQRSAPLGNLALVAGRFHGMGNIAFACLCGAALLGAGILGGQLRERDRRNAGLLLALAVCGVVVIVDAAPKWGDDFGGVLAMPPCVVLLLALLAQIRVTVKRVVLTVIGVVLVGVALSAADYARPAGDRTQIGNFAGEVLHGGAGRTLRRKLYSDVHSFGNVAVTGSVLLLLLAVIACHEQAGIILRRVAGLREAAFAVALLAAVGTADNDSGVVVAEFALVTCLLAVVGAGLTDPVSDVASGRAPLPPPAARRGSAVGGEPFLP
jgi:hypothetical protein